MPDVQSQSLIDALNSQTGEVNFDVPGNGDCAIYAVIKLLLMRAAVEPALRPIVKSMFEKIYRDNIAAVKNQNEYVRDDTGFERPDEFRNFMEDYDNVVWTDKVSLQAFFGIYCGAPSKTNEPTFGDKTLQSLVGCLRIACDKQAEELQKSNANADAYEQGTAAWQELRKQFLPFRDMNIMWLDLVFRESGFPQLMFRVQTDSADVASANEIFADNASI